MAARIHHLAAVSRRWTSNPRLMPNLPPTPSRSTFRGLRTRPRAVPAPPPITPTAGVNLSPEQLTALKLVGEGKNVFITGRAGTGKSKLIAEIRIQAWNRGRKCIVTAPTGVAALLVGGKTLHSWLGVGHGDEHFQHYIDNLNPPSRLSSQEKERDDWQPCSKVNLLIIDEISMVHPHLFNLTNYLGKMMRGNKKPFGGIQVVVCGDFFQLPPVSKTIGGIYERCPNCGLDLPPDCLLPNDSLLSGLPDGVHSQGIDQYRWRCCTDPTCGHLHNETIKYAFQTESWREAGFEPVVLETVFRQKDIKWIDYLARIAKGKADEKVLDFLDGLRRKLPSVKGIKPTKLYSHREKVDEENAAELAKLPGPEYSFRSTDSKTVYQKKTYYPIPKRGVKWKWDLVEKSTPIDPDDPNNADFLRALKSLQCPMELKLKVGAQVMLLVNMLEKGLANGSRGVVTKFELHTLPQPTEPSGSANDINEPTYHEVLPPGGTHFIPVVQFVNSDYEIPIFPETWKISHYRKASHEHLKTVLYRSQIPLALCWATTIHKTQGQTLDYAIADISQCFSPGQAYVTLSRCKSPQGLQIVAGKGREALKKSLWAAWQVVKFYNMFDKQR